MKTPYILGFLWKWYENTEYGIILDIKLHSQTNEERIGRPFTIVDMQTAFYCLGFGLLICFAVFLIEIGWFRYKIRTMKYLV